MAKRNYTKYGLRIQKPDPRDLKVSWWGFMAREELPSKVDLRPTMPTIYNQGALGSCTANAIGGVIQRFNPELSPSRLFLYYNARVLDGTSSLDAGATLRNAMKAANTYGVCDESIWPYDISKFTKRPSGEAYGKATLHASFQYRSVSQKEYDLKLALHKGMPVVFGFKVQPSFESDEVARTGIYNPKYNERILGGHAVVLVGYDDESQRFLVRNSWGKSWGMDGYFTIPYSIVTNWRKAFDFWVIEKM